MTVRKNITMSLETASWYEKKSKEMGVPQSSLMAIALADYIKQESSLKTLEAMLSEIKKQENRIFKWTKEDEKIWNELVAENKKKDNI